MYDPPDNKCKEFARKAKYQSICKNNIFLNSGVNAHLGGLEGK